MRLLRSSVLAGTGRLVGAAEHDGMIDFFIDTGSAIVKRQMPRGRRGIAGESIVSYADAYTESAGQAVSLMAGEIEIKKAH